MLGPVVTRVMGAAVSATTPLVTIALLAMIAAIVTSELRSGIRPSKATSDPRRPCHPTHVVTHSVGLNGSDGAAVTTDGRERQLAVAPEADGWTLCSQLDGLRAYTQASPGEFSFRICASQPSSSPADWMVLVRELDLLPQWLSICDSASALKVASPTELWPFATFRFPWFWPLRPLFFLLHVQLTELAPGVWIITCETDEKYDRTSLPSSGLYSELPLDMVVAKMTCTAVNCPSATEAQCETTVDAVIRVPIAKLTFLGPARHAMANAPAWLVNLAASVVIPFLWQAFINTLLAKILNPSARARAGAADAVTSNPWLNRLRVDDTGLYGMLSRTPGARVTGVACDAPATGPAPAAH